jgi:hypothetical protein
MLRAKPDQVLDDTGHFETMRALFPSVHHVVVVAR